MEIDDKTKKLVHELGDALNSAIEKSTRFAKAIENLREIGYEPILTMRLEIGLQELEQEDDDSILDEVELNLTDDDLQTLRRMRIKLNPDE